MLLVISLSQTTISILPKTSENQSFLKISGGTEMEHCLKIGKYYILMLVLT